MTESSISVHHLVVRVNQESPPVCDCIDAAATGVAPFSYSAVNVQDSPRGADTVIINGQECTARNFI